MHGSVRAIVIIRLFVQLVSESKGQFPQTSAVWVEKGFKVGQIELQFSDVVAVVEEEHDPVTVRVGELHRLEAVWAKVGVPLLAAAGTIPDILGLELATNHVH